MVGDVCLDAELMADKFRLATGLMAGDLRLDVRLMAGDVHLEAGLGNDSSLLDLELMTGEDIIFSPTNILFNFCFLLLPKYSKSLQRVTAL